MPKPSASNQKPVPKPKDQTKRTYTVVSNLQHDGFDYDPGEDVELTKAEAEPLLGHTVKAKEGPKAEAEPPK